MKTWNIPVRWTMKAIVQVDANTLQDAMDLAVKDKTNLPAGEYDSNTLEIYKDLYSWEIREEYNHGQPDEETVEYISPAERERRVEEQRRDKIRNVVVTICTALAIALVIAGMGFMFWSDAQESDAREFLCKNASTSGVVIDKYTSEYRGTCFYVTVKHESINKNGETTTFTQDYRIPWEDFVQIELGDTVHAQYTHYVTSGTWQYISFEKAQE